MDAVLELPDLDATIRLGARLAWHLRPANVVALHGDLGAGKTELARAVIRAAAADPSLIVPSPTFTLVEVYETPRGSIWHFDLYRIETPEQVWELGFEEALADGITLVEWPERLGRWLPAERLDVSLEIVAGEARRARLKGTPDWSAWLATLAREVAHG
jgi:tRNA threonylcarbamoyladenosine biosynthesis protein TsaE